MEKNCCRIANANIQGGRIANPTERGICRPSATGQPEW